MRRADSPYSVEELNQYLKSRVEKWFTKRRVEREVVKREGVSRFHVVMAGLRLLFLFYSIKEYKREYIYR